MILANREYIDCPDCPRCIPQPGLRNGVKWGICRNSGNIVHLEPWKEKRIKGTGWIHHPVSSCGLYEKNKEKSEVMSGEQSKDKIRTT